MTAAMFRLHSTGAYSSTTYVRAPGSQEVVGFVVENGECDGVECKAARENGLPWHVTPAGFGVIMKSYHFATKPDAVVALTEAMDNRRGLRMDLATTEERITWYRDNGGLL
jgi:hypothetical protein